MPKLRRATKRSTCPCCNFGIAPGTLIVLEFKSRRYAHRECVFGTKSRLTAEKKGSDETPAF